MSQAQADPAGFIHAVLTDVFFTDVDDLDATISQYFTDDYRQVTNGEVTNRGEFAEHVAAVRNEVETGSVEVLDALCADGKISDRHIIRATKKDGSELVAELYLWADLAPDGRIRALREVTRLISGTPEDEALASKR